MGRLTRTHEFISYPSRRFKRIVKDTLVIADNESVLAIAGVMGGMDSATQPNSTEGRLTRTHEFISYPSRRFKRIVNT
jgi:phenylalanyl-tRNA synthetase beta subunit